jgi:NADPH:quinone reductase-like Zn-dependent oxidoreductase
VKAIVYERYGAPDVLRLGEVETPEPKGDQVRVRVCTASVNALDWRLMRASPFLARLHSGLLRPRFRILGSDIAGTVEVVGPEARQFRVGDHVFGDLASFGLGGFAEYVCAPERALARKPASVCFEDAAATPMAGMTALQGLRDHGRVTSGQKVLIVGASGGVGTFSIQIAKLLGADVTAVCSTGKVELARRLGADRVIDYTMEDFARGDTRYDVVLAVNGYRSIRDYRRALRPEGIYLMAGGEWPQIRDAMFLGPLLSLGSRQKLGPSEMEASPQDLTFLGALIEQGRIKPVIDRRYSLADVPSAIRYVEAGHAVGKVIVEVSHSPR